MLLKYLPIFFLVLFFQMAQAQETVVKGKITDQATNEAIPFANVKFVVA